MTSAVLDTKIKVVKKTDYYAKKDIERKYFTTIDYYKFASDIIDGRIKLKKLVNESNISDHVKISNLNKSLESLAKKAELKV